MTTGSYTVGDQTGGDFFASKAWNGTDLPKGWRKANPGKPLPINPYTVNLLRQTQSKSKCYWPQDGSEAGDVYVYTCSDTVPARASANLSLAALNEIANEMRGHSFDAAVFAAEARESVATIRGTTAAVLLALRGTLSRNWKDVAQGLALLPGQRNKNWSRKLQYGDISGAWLALQYGWLPLLNDIWEALKALQALQESPRTLKFRAQKREVLVRDWSPGFSDGVLEIKDTTTVRFIVETKEVISVARSLGVTNPMNVLWEKLPWSFVVDWFIPVGDYLQALTFFQGSKTTFVRTEYDVRTIRVKRAATWTSRTGYTSRPTGGSYAARSLRVERTTGTTVILPRPTLKQWAKAFSTGHMKNAAALIHQQVAKTFSVGNRKRYSRFL